MVEYIERTKALMIVDLFHGPRHAYHQIRNLPTADVVPVVHGRWIVTEQENGCAVWNDYTCSVCGSVFDGNDWLFDEWKGCPVCLARMDGE